MKVKDPDIQAMLKQAGNSLPAIDQLAYLLLQRRSPLKPVLQAYRGYLARTPGSKTAAFNYAYYLARDGQFEASVDMYQQSLKLGSSAPEEVHLNIANIYMDHLKKADMARAHLQQALGLKPDYANAYYNLGNLSEQEGDRPEARRCFEHCLKLDPSNQSALARLADAHIFSDEKDPLMSRLITVARTSSNSDLHLAVGRVYEQLSRFEMAWQHFSKANQIDRSSFPAYSKTHTEDLFRRITVHCSEQWLKTYQGRSDEHVFICGMFRTGSTLLEQVLAAHPRFVAGGESEFFPRLVAREFGNFPDGVDSFTPGDARSWEAKHNAQIQKLFGSSIRVTDKRPDNFLYMGLIKAILPSVKFVVTERDWRDIATSVYSTRFGPGQNYATSLKNIRHYIGLQQTLVDHWQSIMGSDLIRVRYEDLVTQPRVTITGLLGNLGETWDEQCLSFNKLKNPVQTASVWQVREPLHSKSVGRWKHYREHFENTFGADSVS